MIYCPSCQKKIVITWQIQHLNLILSNHTTFWWKMQSLYDSQKQRTFTHTSLLLSTFVNFAFIKTSVFCPYVFHANSRFHFFFFFFLPKFHFSIFLYIRVFSFHFFLLSSYHYSFFHQHSSIVYIHSRVTVITRGSLINRASQYRV